VVPRGEKGQPAVDKFRVVLSPKAKAQLEEIVAAEPFLAHVYQAVRQVLEYNPVQGKRTNQSEPEYTWGFPFDQHPYLNKEVVPCTTLTIVHHMDLMERLVTIKDLLIEFSDQRRK